MADPGLRLLDTTTDATPDPPTTGPAPSADTPQPRRLIDRRGVAAYLGLGVATIDRLNAGGKLPRPIRLGGALRWDLAELHAWVDHRASDGTLLERATWESIWRDLCRRPRRH